MMLVRLVAVASVVVGSTSGRCLPSFVGKERLFVVENAGVTRTVPAVEGMQTAEEFYGYKSTGEPSSNTGLERAKTSRLFLYRDMRDASGKVDLFWIHGKQTRTGGARGEVNGLISGIPEGVEIAVRDDNKREFGFTTATVPGVLEGNPRRWKPRVAGAWRYSKRNTDGGVLTGFEKQKDWELEIRAELVEGVRKWLFLFGDESETMVLDENQPTFLRTVSTTTGPDGEVQLYPQEAGTKVTYCGLAVGGKGELEYTFSWGNGRPDTVLTREAGVPVCATHEFCGTIAQCGGVESMYPRTVKVTVRSTHDDCREDPRAREQLLAVEDEVCFSGVLVRADGIPIAPTAGATPLKLHRVPSQFAGMETFVPSTGLREGGVVRLECCGAAEAADGCSFVVSTYHCPPCSRGLNGGFPATLPAAGLTAGSCAPRFGPSSSKMTSFHITVPAGSHYDLPPATANAPFVAVFGRHGVLADWCPSRSVGCGGPCPPSTCVCDIE